MEYKTTNEVARRFGLDNRSLGAYLSRHPHLRPNRRVGMAMLWTEEEIERLAVYRMRPISRGPYAVKNK
jgi:hypothetical protein